MKLIYCEKLSTVILYIKFKPTYSEKLPNIKKLESAPSEYIRESFWVCANSAEYM